MLALFVAFVAMGGQSRAHANEGLDGQCSEAAINRDPSTSEQRRQHCQAAQSSQEGADSNSSLVKVWGAVAGVCTTACATSIAGGPTNEMVCQGTNTAGSATDGIVSRNFSGALQGIASSGGGMAVSQYRASNAAAEAAENGKQAKKEKDVGACMTAATAGVQTYTKYNSMKNAEGSVQSSLDALNGLQGQNAAAVGAADMPAGAGGESAGGVGQASSSLGDGGAVSDPARICRAAKRTSDPALIMKCAVARDPNLPAFVQSPKFPTEFQKTTGQSLSDFLKRDESPKQLLGSAMGANFNASQNTKLAAALGAVEAQLAQGDVEGAAYASGGGGGFDAGGGDGMDPALGEMMAGLMEQLAPKKEGEEQQPGIATVIYANNRHARNPAAIAENPALSIFDRVTYRYYFVGKRMVLEGESR